MDIDENLIQIIRQELGTNSAELFVKFYHGFSLDTQIQGALKILSLTVGPDRAETVLRDFIKVLPKK